MTDAKSAWHEAGERFNSLGTKLKTHYEQQRGQDADQAKAEVRDALHRLTAALDDAFEAIGTAARDDAVKGDVKQVGQSLVTALGATFSQVSAEVQRQFASRTGGPGDQSGAGPATGTPPATAQPGEPPVSGTDPSTLTEPPASTAAAPESETTTVDESAGKAEGKDEGDQPPKVEPWGTP
jgi:hypothetical protein